MPDCFRKHFYKLMMHSPLGFQVEYIQGIQNEIADLISTVFSNSNDSPSYVTLLQQIPKLKDSSII